MQAIHRIFCDGSCDDNALSIFNMQHVGLTSNVSTGVRCINYMWPETIVNVLAMRLYSHRHALLFLYQRHESAKGIVTQYRPYCPVPSCRSDLSTLTHFAWVSRNQHSSHAAPQNDLILTQKWLGSFLTILACSERLSSLSSNIYHVLGS